MAAYPIEILNFGEPTFDEHNGVIAKLNSLQADFAFCLPPERHRLWAAPFAREAYDTGYVWDRLRAYRNACKGFHPFLIALIHGSLSSPNLGNLFGSHEAREGLAVVTTKDWDALFAPPGLAVFLAYYFVRYTMSFVCPDVRNHEETRNCFFDKKLHKEDIKLSMKSGRICDECHNAFENAIDGHAYDSLLRLVTLLREQASGVVVPREKPKVFIGSSSEGLPIAEHLQAGLERAVECTIWSQGVFGLSRGNLENLVNATSRYEFAVLVLTPDDLVTTRGRTENSARDNVLFELGLFMGALGRERTFVVHSRDVALELPSDLAGVSVATFGARSDGNLQAALGPVCTSLKQAMEAAQSK
jgi:predicted nucleotide-binding protein